MSIQAVHDRVRVVQVSPGGRPFTVTLPPDVIAGLIRLETPTCYRTEVCRRILIEYFQQKRSSSAKNGKQTANSDFAGCSLREPNRHPNGSGG